MASWGDDSIRVRMFKAALGVCKHYSDALVDVPMDEESTRHFATLCKRWAFIDGAELNHQACLVQMQQELIPESSDAIFADLSSRLSAKFNPSTRLNEINRAALREAKKCVQAWGGKCAIARAKALALVPLRCESTNQQRTELYFNRGRSPSITIRAGQPATLLEDCMVLHFSLFHEYLSHAFPNWDVDNPVISEDWLLALEMEWFETHFMPFDSALLSDIWDSRGGASYKSARWFLKRCSNECVHKFLLEWAARWRDDPDEIGLDLLAQFKGIAAKTGTALGASPTPKQQHTLKRLETVLCGPCEEGQWDLRQMRDQLEEELALYAAPR